MVILGSVWELLVGSWEHFWLLFWLSLEKWLKCKNDQLSITFGGFLGVGASSGGLEAVLGRFRELCWKMLAQRWCFFGVWGVLWRVLEAVLGGFRELCWKMLAPRWWFLAILGDV